jgi:uncharacterized repeat protein (TIGR01451 family)
LIVCAVHRAEMSGFASLLVGPFVALCNKRIDRFHRSLHRTRRNVVSLGRKLLAATGAGVLSLAVPLAVVAAAGPAYAADLADAGGYAQAYGLSIDTTLLQGNVPVAVGPLADASNECPPTATPQTAQVLGAGDPQVARADVLTTGSGADCAGPKSMAKAQVTNLDALQAAAPATVHADVITTTANADCTAAPSGSTTITNLTVAGTAIPLPTDVPPNTKIAEQVLAPLGLTIIANEQHPTADGRGIVVNGLHIIGSDSGAAIPIGGSVLRGDVIIAHSLAGVVCPNGAGTTATNPEIVFTKNASPTTAKPGQTVTYTATVTNKSATPCDVLRFVDHLSPAFSIGSTAGGFGTAYDKPAPTRSDTGQEIVLRPSGLTLKSGQSLTQTFTVTVNDSTKPGTYYNTLELFCGPNGDFASGPLAPVTVPAAVVAPAVQPPPAPAPAPQQLPRTGASPLVAASALLLLGAGLGVRRALR